jgi:GH15 family glucan-1,4-alpha-glucosidase
LPIRADSGPFTDAGPHHADKVAAESDPSWPLQKALLEFLESAWGRPDSGLWEMRGPARHFTYSKVMAWVAVDRAIQGAEGFGLPAPLEQWRALREKIRDDVLVNAYDPDRNTFTQSYGSRFLDASLLNIPLVGFLKADDPRVVGTVKAVTEDLMTDSGLLLRYDPLACEDGLPGPEGAFLACTFWLAECQALLGRVEEATETFERLLDLRNDLGLLSEEYDPVAKRLVGNFPQAFSHVPLINAAANLQRAQSNGPQPVRSDRA